MLAGAEAFRSIPNHGSHLTWWTNDGLRQLNLLLGTIFLAQFLNGYDASLVSGFQSMKPWLKNLGNPDSDHIGLLNAATYLAGLCTAPFAAFIADRWGRKWCIRYSSVTNLIGTAIGAAAGSGGTNGYAMFIMSRIIIGSGLAFALMCSPIMLQELPHPKHRTWMAGFFDVAFIIGNFVAAWVNFGCSHLTNNWAWRIPYLIHIGPALIMIVLISYVPESPRWLIKNDDELVAFEYAEIQEALRMERETKQDTWKNLSGTAIISYYYTSILKLVGITDTVTQTGINAGLTSFTFLMALFGLWLTQRVKRRPQLLGTWFAVLCANIGLTVCTAEYTKTKNKGAGIGAVVFVWLYNGAFFVSCGPIFFSYPAEVLHYSMRGKGMMVWAMTAKCLSVFSAYTNPVAMRNIGYKWYTFYTAIIIVTGICIYFFIVETKGHTLEEIGQLFDGKPLETSLHPELATVEYKGKGDSMVQVRGVPDEENSLDRKSES
ncbi:major facilitator superfamily domain-containing protein [Armillaria novae-zelandiae]|uniref:Major facilitator superfamily domain-containing protein n=1 Tax=Armillaria novae-zelandiae TaxID=153914 RepID=A0AA39PST3_9AGAR|nr:major facilitator superfamily domain-containing protein [Armillaria novae-zelandiae]